MATPEIKQKLPQHIIDKDKRQAEIGMKHYRLRCPEKPERKSEKQE